MLYRAEHCEFHLYLLDSNPLCLDKSTVLFELLFIFLFFLSWTCFSPAAKCKTVYIAYKDKWNKRETSLFLKLATGVKQRAFGDWHIQRVSCQSCAQSISSSQSVLFVCWICFGTCRPLIDMGAGAGKTLLWCEANNGPSVTPPQMFGLRGYTGIIMVQKSGHSLSCSHSLSSCSLFTCSCYSKTFSFGFFSP